MEDTLLYHNEWISLRKIAVPAFAIKGHVYSRETRCNGRIIAILPFRGVLPSQDAEFLLRSEVTPCWDATKPVLSTITGGWEEKGIEQVAVDEVLEETGYIITKDELISLGDCFGTKSTDTIYSLFAVNLANKLAGKPTGEDSTPETHNTAVWVNAHKLMKCNDPLMGMILLRLAYREATDGEAPTESDCEC